MISQCKERQALQVAAATSARRRVRFGPSEKAFGVKNIGGTPRLFLAKSAEGVGKMGDAFRSWQREAKSEAPRERDARGKQNSGSSWLGIPKLPPPPSP